MSVATELSSFNIARIAGMAPTPFDFEMAVPGDCEAAAAPCDPATRSAFGPAPLFYVRSSERGFDVAVYVARLKDDVDAGDLVAIDAEASGHTVVQRRAWPGTHGCQAEVITRKARDGENWLTRSRAVKDGAVVFRIDAAAPEQEFKDAERECALTVLSFRLMHPAGKTCCESLSKTSFSRPAPIAITHGDSWSVVDHHEDDAASRIELRRTFDERFSATLQVEFHRKQPGASAEHLRNFARRLQSQGFQFTGAPILPVSPSAGCVPMLQYAPLARRDDQDWCVGAMMLQRRDADVILSFQGPTQEQAPWVWAIMRRAFESIREGLIEMPHLPDTVS